MTTLPDNLISAPGNGRSVFIETYGCQMNVADTQLIRGMLTAAGYISAPDLASADVILVNTCAVRENAEARVMRRLENLKPFKDKRPDVVMGITGCMAEHLREQLLERAPYVDLVAGPDTYRRLANVIAQASTSEPVVDVRQDRTETYEGAPTSRVDGVVGFLSVQRGCDKFCTFCIVPFVRGRERSSAPREVLRQARAMAQQGAREVTLLGQTVNSYRYEEVDFADLLTAVHQIDGVARIRFTSPYPLDFSPKLIDTMARLPKVMPHLHLPLQSGCNDVLARMKRGHTVEEYLALVDRIRSAIPNVALTTDIIVGFPSESDASYQRTLEVVRQVRFDSAFMFLYSERSHTTAKKRMPDDIPLALKKRRLTELIEMQESISAEVNLGLVGTEVELMVTGTSRRSDDFLTGKTDTFKSAIFPILGLENPPCVGDIVRVKVERTTSHSLKGPLTRVVERA